MFHVKQWQDNRHEKFWEDAPYGERIVALDELERTIITSLNEDDLVAVKLSPGLAKLVLWLLEHRQD